MTDEALPTDIVGKLSAMTDAYWLGTRTARMKFAAEAISEIERLRAENTQLRSSIDSMVKHVSNEELARAVEAAKKRLGESTP